VAQGNCPGRFRRLATYEHSFSARTGQVLTGDRGTWTNSPTSYSYSLAALRSDRVHLNG